VRSFRTVRRSIDRFREDPGSIGSAARLIVTATVLAVIVGGVAVWLLDREEYPNLGRALWFTLQTVTTVGYGDVTPTSAVGRAVGAIVMLVGIGFITIITASITSTFVAAARRREARASEAAGAEGVGPTEEALAEVAARLDRIEQALERLTGTPGPP
jgi:voltage-gated potassium channel Kch